VVQLDPERLSVSRDRVIELLHEAGIGASVHFIPLHLHPFYRKAFGTRARDFPAATRAFERILSLPIYPRLTDPDVARVVEALRAVLKARRR
jgi:perosamine synthetase